MLDAKTNMKTAIIVAIIAGVFSLVNTIVSYKLNQKIETLSAVVYKPSILIESPSMDQRTDPLLRRVSGFVKGDVPANHKILVGHRELSEQEVKIHADRVAEVLSDKSFRVENIQLGTDSEGVGKTFEIYVLLVSNATIDKLNMKDGDNPLRYMPESVVFEAIRVIRG